MIRELYYKLRYRKWAVVDICDQVIIYRGDWNTCRLVQDTQYAGLLVLPVKQAELFCTFDATVAESGQDDKR